METLDQYRLDVATLAQVQRRTGEPVDPRIRVDLGSIGPRYFQRRIVKFHAVGDYRWLDVRLPTIHARVLNEMAPEFSALGVGSRITLGHLLGGDYRISQTFTRWAIDNGFHGIVYASCHDLKAECWAMFEGVTLRALGAPEPIRRDDPDLLAVAQLWNLTLPD